MAADRTDGGVITDAAVALPAMGEVHRSDTVTAPLAPQSGPIRITANSNRPPAVLWRLRDRLDIDFIRIGSAGAKAMAVVRGDADAYIHAGGQWEWDSAAPAGVLQVAGLHATRLDGSPLRYNQPDPYLPDLLMCRAEWPTCCSTPCGWPAEPGQGMDRAAACPVGRRSRSPHHPERREQRTP